MSVSSFICDCILKSSLNIECIIDIKELAVDLDCFSLVLGQGVAEAGPVPPRSSVSVSNFLFEAFWYMSTDL